MRITITIDANETEAAALVTKLKEVFGDNVQIDSAPVQPASPGAPPEQPVTPPVEATGPPARGQIFKNPQLTGETVVYDEWQIGPKEWWLTHHLGESRMGGETQGVRCELKRPDTSFEGYDRYLSEQYGNTALEMGGAFRTFHWEFHQSDVPVRGGFTYDLTAVFHPLVKNKMEDGAEEFMGIDIAGDWFSNLEWRWVARSVQGEVLAADDWQDGETLGTLSFDLPFEQPHKYTWRWTAPKSDSVTFSLEFRNKWGLAMTKVWLHEATCVER